MSDQTETRPAADAKLPALGRALASLANLPVMYGLYGICAVLLVAELFYTKKTYVPVEEIPGFYAFLGFVTCGIAVFCAKALGAMLRRPEDFYAPNDVETEPYPEEGLGRERVDD